MKTQRERIAKAAKMAQGLDPENEPLPYEPNFDKNTTRINNEILNLEKNMSQQFKKHPNNTDLEVGDRMNECWDLLNELKKVLYDLDQSLFTLE